MIYMYIRSKVKAMGSICELKSERFSVLTLWYAFAVFQLVATQGLKVDVAVRYSYWRCKIIRIVKLYTEASVNDIPEDKSFLSRLLMGKH